MANNKNRLKFLYNIDFARETSHDLLKTCSLGILMKLTLKYKINPREGTDRIKAL